MKSALSLSGRVTVSVIGGKTVSSKNLILNTGLNAIATTAIADIFKWCARGTGATANKEAVVGSAYTLSASLSTLTRASGTRDFTAADVGKLVVNQDGKQSQITALDLTTPLTKVIISESSHETLVNYTEKTISLYDIERTALDAEIDRTEQCSATLGENGYTDAAGVRTLKRTFIFPPQPEESEAVTGDYSWAATTVTRTTGTRDFTAADVGKYIRFASGVFCKISSFTNATTVTVDRGAGSAVTAAIELLGWVEYGEVGFSATETDPINIRARLEDGSGASTPVRVIGQTPETPGQQLKVTYELEVSVSPATITPAAALPITGGTSGMFSSTSATSVIEFLSLSSIESDGDTNTASAILEPAFAGAMALSSVTSALIAMNGPDRSPGAASVDLENAPYSADSFQIASSGTFGLTEAVATNWKTLGIYDPQIPRFAMTFFFASVQKKDGNHSLTIVFQKSWGRKF